MSGENYNKLIKFLEENKIPYEELISKEGETTFNFKRGENEN